MTYHCQSRCVELRDLFASRLARNIAISVIKKTLEKYSFELIFLEFVENHFHLIIRTVDDGETVSRIMQYIKSRIAERYNFKVGRTGPFWNERFKSDIIEEYENPQKALLYLIWKISYNLVRKGVIRNPRESEYGTIRVYLEKNYIPKVKITLHKLFLTLGQSFEECVKAFLPFEQLYLRHHPPL
jgi:REP element-mobilizing transposase RayT